MKHSCKGLNTGFGLFPPFWVECFMHNEYATSGDTIFNLHNTTKWNILLAPYVSLSAYRGAAWGAQRTPAGNWWVPNLFLVCQKMHDSILTAQYKEAEVIPGLKHLHHQARSKSHILKRVNLPSLAVATKMTLPEEYCIIFFSLLSGIV